MRSVISVSVWVLALCAAALPQDSRPAEVYTAIRLTDVEHVSDKWGEYDDRWMSSGERMVIVRADVMAPAEAALVWPEWEGETRITATLFLRSEPGRDVPVTLTLPGRRPGTTAQQIQSRVPAARLGNATRAQFLEAARTRFRALLDARVPGSAWFRHRLAEIARELPPQPATPDARSRRMLMTGRADSGDDAYDTYDFFSGGRAVAENLRLDRALAPIDGGTPSVMVWSMPGITTASFDWKPLTATLKPAKDALASLIPEDQHAAFFPSLQALSVTLDELEGAGRPILWGYEERCEDSGARSFYERQLAVSVANLAGSPAGATVTSVAITGSDPYFSTGTDVAVLFECARPDLLAAEFTARHAAAAKGRPDAAPVEGELAGKKYFGVATKDRGLSSFVAVFGHAVVVTNSTAQLDRVVRTSATPESSLAASLEYTFFRDRYARGAADESAFILLTDATIRRWCSPRWRIGDSRRTRAAAQLAEITARAAQAIVRVSAGPVPAEGMPEGLGALSFTAEGVHSGTYGNLRFLRPILELEIEKATQSEVDAYAQFRDAYQRRWAQYFDPIAMRLGFEAGRMSLDVTVMPLVAISDYRDLMEFCRGARISPTGCDPHDSAVVQFVVALDPAAGAFSDWPRRAERLLPGLESVALSWLKGGISVALDTDPILDKIFAHGTADPQSEQLMQLPLLLTAEVKDPVALVAFLTGIRAVTNEMGLGTVRWTKDRHGDFETMTLEASEGFIGREPSALHYAIADHTLFVALRKDVLHRALDRVLDRRAPDSKPATPWLGDHAAIHVDRNLVDLLMRLDGERESRRQADLAWSALPILSEWRRLFPDEDPVAVHEKLFKLRLSDPAGGRYVVDAAHGIVSEFYGHPTDTRPGPARPKALEGLRRARAGLTFENDGLRGRLVIERETK